MIKNFKIFTRTFWRENPDWPKGLEPHMGKKKTIGYAETEEKARAFADDYNSTHNPGRYSRKAEFTKY